MLAQNFKTPVALDITDDQFEALVKTLGVLDRGETVWIPYPKKDFDRYSERFDGQFNMGTWNVTAECGTVCCIGGTAELIGRLPLGSLRNRSCQVPALRELFDGGDITRQSTTTPAQAAIALRNYLTHGEPRWAEALAA